MGLSGNSETGQLFAISFKENSRNAIYFLLLENKCCFVYDKYTKFESLIGLLCYYCGVDGSNRNGDQERNRKLPPQMVPDPNYRRHLNSRLRT